MSFWKSSSFKSPSSALMLGMRSTAVGDKLSTTSTVAIFGARRVSTRLANNPGKSKTLQTYFSNCRSLLRESSIHAGNTAPRSCRRSASSCSRQQRLYLMPLPQWHASLRPSRGGRTTSLTLFEVSSLKVRPIVSRSGVPRGCWIVVRSLLLGPLFHGLSTPQRPQLSIRGEDLSHGVLELASLLDQRTDLLHPFLRDMLDALLAIHHECQRPRRMSLAIRAPTGGFSAVVVSQGE